MAVQIQLRRGTTAEHNTFTGVIGEITMDTTKNVVVVHNGSVVGGFPLALASGSAITAASLLVNNNLNITTGNSYQINGNTVLSATALGSSVTASSLTSVGTLTSLTVSGLISGSTGVNVTKNGSDTRGSGPYFQVQNAAGTRFFTWQLGDTANDLFKLLSYDGATERTPFSISLTGNATFLGSATVSGDLTVDTSTLKVDSTNNRVGIGTTSPAAGFALDVSGAVQATGNVSAGSAGTVTSGFVDGLAVAAWQAVGYQPSAGNLLVLGGYRSSQWVGINFFTSGTSKMLLDTSGNLGLGVTPSYPLHVAAARSADTVMLTLNGTGTGANGDKISLNFRQNTGADAAQYDLARISSENESTSGANGSLVFSTMLGTTLAEKARITPGGLFQVKADGANQTFTNGGQIALKNTGSAPYISWHESTGARIGYLQMSSSGNSNLWVEANQPLAIATNNTERARIPAAGGFQVVGALSVGNATPVTSGAGITFPATQSASSDANTLDDYEEGTWTPAFSATGRTFTHGSQSGSYTKIGRLVVARMYLRATVDSQTATDIVITGLPFTTTTGGLDQYALNIGYVDQFVSPNYAQMIGYAPNNATTINVLWTNSTSVTNVQADNFPTSGAGGYVIAVISYFTS